MSRRVALVLLGAAYFIVAVTLAAGAYVPAAQTAQVAEPSVALLVMCFPLSVPGYLALSGLVALTGDRLGAEQIAWVGFAWWNLIAAVQAMVGVAVTTRLQRRSVRRGDASQNLDLEQFTVWPLFPPF